MQVLVPERYQGWVNKESGEQSIGVEVSAEIGLNPSKLTVIIQSLLDKAKGIKTLKHSSQIEIVRIEWMKAPRLVPHPDPLNPELGELLVVYREKPKFDARFGTRKQNRVKILFACMAKEPRYVRWVEKLEESGFKLRVVIAKQARDQFPPEVLEHLRFLTGKIVGVLEPDIDVVFL